MLMDDTNKDNTLGLTGEIRAKFLILEARSEISRVSDLLRIQSGHWRLRSTLIERISETRYQRTR